MGSVWVFVGNGRWVKARIDCQGRRVFMGNPPEYSTDKRRKENRPR